MQSNLPANCDPRFVVLPSVAGEALAPVPVPQMPPNMDPYSSVCVHVREASFIASHDPIACNHPAALSAIGPPPQAGGNFPPGNFGAANHAVGKVPAKRSASPGQLIGWICVVQLGVIIGMLGGQSWHIDQAAKSVKDSLWAVAAPGLGFMFQGTNGAATVPQVHLADTASGKTSALTQKKGSKSRSGRGKRGAGSSFASPIAREFIPPPPPFIPGAKMMVPPPPVAVSLFDKAPGAVAASTLPNASIPLVREPNQKTEPKTPKQPLEPVPLQRSIGLHSSENQPPVLTTLEPAVGEAPAPGAEKTASAATAAAVALTTAPASAPAAAISVPAKPVQTAIAAVPATAQAVPTQAAPNVPAVVPTTKPAPHPSQSQHVAHAAPAQTAPQPSVRTVITGHRKRTITDR